MTESDKPILTPEARSYLGQLASLGGKARARKYSRRALSKWAKLGGRPRKDGTKPSARGRRKKS